MSIVNMLQLDKLLVAACDNGCLILWDVQEEIDNTITDIDGIAPSLGSSKFILRLAPQLKGFQQSGEKLIGFNVTTLYVVLKTDIYKAIDEGQFFKSIFAIKFSQGASQIECVKAVDQNILLIGTDDNYLYKYSLIGRKVDQRVKVYQENMVSHKMKLFCTEPQKKVRVISICLDKDQRQALIGLSNGHIYKIQVSNLKIISQFPTYASSLVGLMPLDNQKCFLSIHQGFMIDWNATTNEYSVKVEVSCANGGIKLIENIYLIVGLYPELHWVSEAAVYSIGITPRVSSCVRMVAVGPKRYVAVGGSDGIVDVFCKNKHILVLFPSADRVID